MAKENILTKTSLKRALKLAQTQAKSGDVLAAIGIYKDILDRFPNNLQATTGLESLQSTSLVSEPFKSEPSKHQVDLLKKLISEGQFEQALQQITDSLIRHPNSGSLLVFRGACHTELRQFDEAINSFKRALKLDPNSVSSQKNLMIAYRAASAFSEESGDIEEAKVYYEAVLEIGPTNSASWLDFGVFLARTGYRDQAIEAFINAAKHDPKNALAHHNLGSVYQELGRFEEASGAYTKALEIDPNLDTSKHMVAALSADVTTKIPAQHVMDLFDNFAPTFEKKLVKDLNYQIPNLIAEVLQHEFVSLAEAKILDLGCGTGLVGEAFRGKISGIDGVDISEKMIEEASKKNIYQSLARDDITNHLTRMTLDYDFYIAADVFVYVGCLKEIFSQLKVHARKSSHLVFSTEHELESDIGINKMGRYTHSTFYIETLCEQFDFKMYWFDLVDLRKERGTTVSGGLYILTL